MFHIGWCAVVCQVIRVVELPSKTSNMHAVCSTCERKTWQSLVPIHTPTNCNHTYLSLLFSSLTHVYMCVCVCVCVCVWSVCASSWVAIYGFILEIWNITDNHQTMASHEENMKCNNLSTDALPHLCSSINELYMTTDDTQTRTTSNGEDWIVCLMLLWRYVHLMLISSNQWPCLS